jgi:hypothetical protein
MTKDELNLDEKEARQALWMAYSLLLRLVEEKADGGEDSPQESAPPTAQDGAREAPSQTGA